MERLLEGKIHPEFLKAPDGVVVVVDMPLQDFVKDRDSAPGLADWGGSTPFQEGGPESLFQF